MVNLNKWEEVDFFDIRVHDEIKGIIVLGPTLSEVVTGKVAFVSTDWAKTEGCIRLEKGGESHELRRDRVTGKPEGTALYRRKPPTQEELDAKFDLTEKLGTIISSVRRNSCNTGLVYHVWDGGEWSTATTSIDTEDFRAGFKEFKLVREGIDIG